MKRIVFAFLILSLIAASATALRASDYVGANGIANAQLLINSLIADGVIPPSVSDIIGTKTLTATYNVTGDESRPMSFKGIVDFVLLKINGNGTKLGAYNTTQFAANNQSVTPLNFTYYPRNITLTFKGYEWWNSSNQHIVNNTGANIATTGINETDGSWSVVDDYNTVNPIWQTKAANITVNTTGGWLEASDTVAETISIVYNITIDDGTFVTATLNNGTFYVAPNTTAAATQDDLNIYLSNDSGTTWYLIKDGADGSTSTGTQYIGTIDLTPYVSGKSSFLLNITFTSDGVDDDASQPDVHFDTLFINGTVSKLPTRNPKIDLNNDGMWDYGTVASLTNSTSLSVSLNDSDLNLTNSIKVYAEGSQKVIVNFTWYDEGRVHINRVVFAGENKTLDSFIAAGENVTVQLLNVTRPFAPVTMTIDADTQNTLSTSYNYTVTIDRFGYMLMSDAVLSISPVDGVLVESYKSTSEPIPVFVKPRNAEVSVAVNTYYPPAGVADTYLNMTLASTSGNVVDVVVTNISSDISQLDLYIDGDYVKTLNVTDGAVYFNVSSFSVHTVSLIVSGALAAPPAEIDWYWVAGVIMVAVLFIVLIYLGVVTLRRR